MQVIDTGIFQRLLGLSLADQLIESDWETINKGTIAEQYVGLEILKAASCYRSENLYYWSREAKSSNAEVDYVVQQGMDIVPIEVKSGTKGSMQSMYLFIEEKKSNYGVRFSLENHAEYGKIKVIPIYNVANFRIQKLGDSN